MSFLSTQRAVDKERSESVSAGAQLASYLSLLSAIHSTETSHLVPTMGMPITEGCLHGVIECTNSGHRGTWFKFQLSHLQCGLR